LDVFTGRDNLYSFINRRFRNVLTAARPYQERFDSFVNDVIGSQDDIVYQLSYCFRAFPRAFENESNEDILRIENCYSDSA
jgi:hypothetical protein